MRKRLRLGFFYFLAFVFMRLEQELYGLLDKVNFFERSLILASIFRHCTTEVYIQLSLSFLNMKFEFFRVEACAEFFFQPLYSSS